jgi:hypothetical protein
MRTAGRLYRERRTEATHSRFLGFRWRTKAPFADETSRSIHRRVEPEHADARRPRGLAGQRRQALKNGFRVPVIR